MNYSRFIGRVSARRLPSITREMTKLMADSGPDVIPLSTGMPNAAMFPFSEMSVTVADGRQIKVSGAAMKASLQYLPTNGHAELLTRLRDMQEKVHGLNKDFWTKNDVIVTNGSQDGLCKAMEMLTAEDDPVLVEDFIYTGTLSILDPIRPKYVIASSDAQGMRPDSLASVLKDRFGSPDAARTKATSPKYIYINPSGANPTGTVIPEERKRQIYKICSDYDLLILEDDPYYFMQYGPSSSEALERSFLSMDTDGRVLRFDSFSKILSSGLRLGFVTGPRPLIDKIALHMQVSVLHAASLSQVVTNELLREWGHSGLMAHLQTVTEFYRRRRDLMVEAADKHLKDLCQWNVPQGGMFLWIKVNGVADTTEMLMKRGMSKKIMLIPGKYFVPGGGEAPCAYMRAAFSLAPEDKIDVAFQRLAELIREEKQRAN